MAWCDLWLEQRAGRHTLSPKEWVRHHTFWEVQVACHTLWLAGVGGVSHLWKGENNACHNPLSHVTLCRLGWEGCGWHHTLHFIAGRSGWHVTPLDWEERAALCDGITIILCTVWCWASHMHSLTHSLV